MSISLRKHRALILEYHDAGSEGSVDSTYLVIASSAADEMWWCSKAAPSGHEVTTGMQPDHRVDAVFGFAAEVPVAPDLVIRMADGESFTIRAVLPRDYGRDELQVYAERTVEQTLTES
jgi:hypothetical protein